mgnify:CR=1 FL=1
MSDQLSPSFPILVVDDERYVVESMVTALRSEGITNVFGISDPAEVLDQVDSLGAGIVVLDLIMPGIPGEEVLRRIRQERPEVFVVVVSGNRDIDRAVDCMRQGAADYLQKPVQKERLVVCLRRLIDGVYLSRENESLRRRLLDKPAAPHPAFNGIITSDPSMLSIMRYVETAAQSPHPFLIYGETGTGKELFARAVHEVSGRSGDFVALNAAGLDDTFFSDTLFGHVTGAFTGAVRSLPGLVEKARDGSLFLDEIGEIPPASQVKLLRLIETGEYYPLGSDLLRRSRARIILATNRDLAAEVEGGRFRKDLYYRLSSHRVELPPLRSRKGDIPALVEHFLASVCGEGRPLPALPRALLDLFLAYDYPGNVRELEAIVRDSLRSGCEAAFDPAVLRARLGSPRPGTPEGPTAGLGFSEILPTIKQATELLIEEALRRADGNQAQAARLLRISPQAVSKRLKKRSD